MNNNFLKNIYSDEKINNIYKNFVYTPMMKEWKFLKEELSKKYWQNTILFYQVGSFYETYFHDAIVTSKILGFTLTSKNKNKENAVPMAWMPLVTDKSKIIKLLKMNFNIVFVDEYNENNSINRKISKIITPSTNLDFLDKNESYLLSIYESNIWVWFSLLDISTWKFKFLNISYKEIDKIDLLYKYNINEVIINKEPNDIIKNFLNNVWLNYYHIIDNKNKNHIGLIEFHFWTLLEELELYHYDEAIIATWEALYYAKQITNSELEYIIDIENILNENIFNLDKSTIKNLELVETYSWWRKNSVYWILNNTLTPFGSRELRNLILNPLIDENEIKKRLEQVEYFVNNKNKLEEIRLIMSKFYDIEKLSTKLANNTINPIDLINLNLSLQNIDKLKWINIDNQLLRSNLNNLNNYEIFNEKINKSLLDNPNVNIKEGNIFKEWYNEELDRQREIFFNIEKILKEKEKELQNSSGITNLKIINNNQWFFIEIKKEYINNILPNWVYIKSLNNSIRYINNDIEDLTNEYRLAEFKIKEIEYNLFQSLRIDLSLYIKNIMLDAKILALIDIITTFSYNAIIYNYNKPTISKNNINIKNWRHVIIEYIKWEFNWNNFSNKSNKNIKIITGPNMWWKSTYLKQIALIFLLFQIGSFIPADKNSELKIIDWIFTRIWASDNLEEWLSTFAMEMIEMWYICNNYTDKSLVLIDEIWRWTDNINWLSLAESFLEFFINNNKGIILFSTHYSELIKEFISAKNIETLKAMVKIENNNIIFLHKIIQWIEDNSYGIEIANLYNIPNQIIDIAFKKRKKRKNLL